MGSALSAHAQMTAQAQTAQAGPAELPEQVLITGSLIQGAAAVGVPVSGTLPSHYKQMLASSDVGMPLYDADRRAPITKALLQIVREITGNKSQERDSLLQRALPAFLRS